MPRLYRVRVRYWPNERNTKGMHECKIMLEAENIDAAFQEGKELALAKVWFGCKPDNCEVVEAASITLPYVL